MINSFSHLMASNTFNSSPKRALLFALACLLLAGCVSKPEGGSKFDPLEGAKHIDENIDMTLDRVQSRSYEDHF